MINYGQMDYKNFFLRDRLTEQQIEKFKLFEDEELIFACREHWLPLVLRVIQKSLAGIIMSLATGFVIFFALNSVSLAATSFLLVLFIGSILVVRDLIHWSFHLYIATNKQIIEIHYSPLLSEAINSILLDQIRCTEIDVDMFGIIPELIGIGNVELTFDRPTHKEQFIIRGIRSPRSIANLLSAQIHQNIPINPNISQKPLWIRELKKNKYKFVGDTPYGYLTN